MKNLYVYKLVRAAKLSEKMQPSSTEGITRSSQNNLLRRKSKHSRDI